MRPSKPVSESKSIISSQMLPSDANPMGFVHGGTILKLVDVAAGVTSMEVGVRIEAEELKTGKVTHTGSSYLTYVALDESAKPTEIPDVVPETPEEKRRWRDAKRRREERLRMVALVKKERATENSSK